MSASRQEYAYRSAEPGCAHDYLLPRLLRLLGPPRGAILDLGCGNGAIAHALLAQGYDVHGVDASESGIRLANEIAPGRFFVMDVAAGELPGALAGRRFDAVISTEVIEHLYHPRGLIALARNCLADAGVLIVSTPYHGYLKNLALAVSGRLDPHFTVLWDGGHIKFFSRATLERMLQEEGFVVEEFAGAGRWPLFWKSMLVKARLPRARGVAS